jgi:hypothetical protein
MDYVRFGTDGWGRLAASLKRRERHRHVMDAEIVRKRRLCRSSSREIVCRSVSRASATSAM